MNLIFDAVANNKRRGTVVKHSHGLDGRAIGCLHTNPFFDAREYNKEITDGTQDKYTANLIAENMYAQVEGKDNQFQLLAEIQDHWKVGTAISKEEGKIGSANGTNRDKIMTRGWDVMVIWKDGSMDCIQLKDIKDPKLVKICGVCGCEFYTGQSSVCLVGFQGTEE